MDNGKGQHASNVHQITDVNGIVEPCDTANRNCKNGNEKTAMKVRSMPDLPKVTNPYVNFTVCELSFQKLFFFLLLSAVITGRWNDPETSKQ